MVDNRYYEFRRTLVERLSSDLVGPRGGEDEVIQDLPITQYVSGVLYAKQSGTIDPVEDRDLDDEDGEGVTPDPPVALANVRYPSSMGMTFALSAETPSVTLNLSAAKYEKLGSTDGEKWQRKQLELGPIEIDLTDRFSRYIDTNEAGLKLFCRVRLPDDTGAVPVTAVLVNVNEKSQAERGDSLAYFQPSIEAVTTKGTPSFTPRGFSGRSGEDGDLASYRLLYRYVHEFGVGHGCSVSWEEAPNEPGRARKVATTFVPTQDVLLFGSNPAIQARAVEMRGLITNERTEVVSGLRDLSRNYLVWIREHETENLPEDLRNTAAENLRQCSEAYERMEAGIDLIAEDEKVWRAFRLMNRAMLTQRSRATWLRDGKPPGGPNGNGDHRWFPFQLAFILVCIRGIHDPEHADRELADLLWFPTGGGKTEAYLGLIAFTIFLRRLKREDGGGVTALMRYTLRLLTIQQFERAALLIACCESIRREYNELGDEEISIGLWVGRSASPSTLKDTRTALERLRKNQDITESNPIQLHSCPWCGSKMGHKNYWIANAPRRLVISCQNKGCEFEKRLPVYVVDEDIYRYHPTLIIATVDKYASLPWRDETRNLFNMDKPTQVPPELIIQDELHLISGPLGTIVGLYETAIDVLCSYEGLKPKIIASTATIRRAHQQTLGLFNRQVSQFPPPGTDARDSYFAVEMPPGEKGSRLYVGLMAPGTSHATLLVRTYASALQEASDLDAPNEIKDPYWTLVGYFNSLRVLGGARMQVQDDVNDRINLLSNRAETIPRPIEETIELTSRESSGAIPEHLKRMAVELPASPLDVILATNMISVGVDIDRLGLMAVMGQPQATSEYIQATSRVGRRYPGLVLVLFNSARSRDRSHYESFAAYHLALYRQVEATSVTPFSPRARDRALHAVLIALARLTIPELSGNDAAFSVAKVEPKLQKLVELILDRVDSVSPQDRQATAEQLEDILKSWRDAAARGELVYEDFRKIKPALLSSASDAVPDNDAFATLWSMRDVDQESNLYLLRE